MNPARRKANRAAVVRRGGWYRRVYMVLRTDFQNIGGQIEVC